MSDTLRTAQQYAEQKEYEKAYESVEQFIKKWEKGNKIIATFVKHTELDTIDQSKSKLLPYLKSKDIVDFNSECEAIKAQLAHILHSEEFSLDNIF